MVKSTYEIFSIEDFMGAYVPRPSALGPYPRSHPSAPISSAVSSQNIARANLWIKHITCSRLYIFKTFEKLLERPSYGVQNKWEG